MFHKKEDYDCCPLTRITSLVFAREIYVK